MRSCRWPVSRRRSPAAIVPGGAWSATRFAMIPDGRAAITPRSRPVSDLARRCSGFIEAATPSFGKRTRPTLAKTDEALDKFVADYIKTGDANDMLYAVEASHDYDPAPGLERIRRAIAGGEFGGTISSIPPELGLLESGMKRVPTGRFVIVPLSDQTRGHGSHTFAVLWKAQLEELLRNSAPR